MECSSNADAALVPSLRSIGCADEAIQWCEDQGLESCSDLQLVAENFLPMDTSLRQFWAKVRGKPVTLVADIVAVKRETQHKVEVKRKPVAPFRLS